MADVASETDVGRLLDEYRSAIGCLKAKYLRRSGDPNQDW